MKGEQLLGLVADLLRQLPRRTYHEHPNVETGLILPAPQDPLDRRQEECHGLARPGPCSAQHVPPRKGRRVRLGLDLRHGLQSHHLRQGAFRRRVQILPRCEFHIRQEGWVLERLLLTFLRLGTSLLGLLRNDAWPSRPGSRPSRCCWLGTARGSC